MTKSGNHSMINSRADLIASIDEEFEAIIPEHGAPNHAALGYALGKSLGVLDPNTFDEATQAASVVLDGVIGQPDHTVLLLLDGFGMNFVDTLPADSYVRRNIAR